MKDKKPPKAAICKKHGLEKKDKLLGGFLHTGPVCPKCYKEKQEKEMQEREERERIEQEKYEKALSLLKTKLGVDVTESILEIVKRN